MALLDWPFPNCGISEAQTMITEKTSLNGKIEVNAENSFLILLSRKFNPE